MNLHLKQPKWPPVPMEQAEILEYLISDGLQVCADAYKRFNQETCKSRKGHVGGDQLRWSMELSLRDLQHWNFTARQHYSDPKKALKK